MITNKDLNRTEIIALEFIDEYNKLCEKFKMYVDYMNDQYAVISQYKKNSTINNHVGELMNNIDKIQYED